MRAEVITPFVFYQTRKVRLGPLRDVSKGALMRDGDCLLAGSYNCADFSASCFHRFFYESFGQLLNRGGRFAMREAPCERVRRALDRLALARDFIRRHVA